jgi:hypothetical protein
VNPGRLPQDFDFACGRGTGEGLELVRALLPRAGCSVRFEERAGQVAVELALEPPVIAEAALRTCSERERKSA